MEHESSARRLAFLDGLRGLAALDVVITHFGAIFYPFALFGGAYSRHRAGEEFFWLSPLGIFLSGQFAVCLFFVLSGFVLSLRFLGPAAASNTDLRTNLVKRVFRLAGLLLATSFVGYLLIRADLFHNVLVSQATGSTPWFSHMWQVQLSVFEFAKLMLFHAFSETNGLNPPLWTIEYELYGSYLTLGLLLLFRSTRFRFIAYGIAAVYFLGSYYQCFLIGLVFADLQRNSARWSKAIDTPAVAAALLASGLFLGAYPAYLVPADLEHSIYGFLPAVDFIGGGYSTLGAALVLIGTLGSRWLHGFLTNRPIAFLGKISFALYSCHLIVQGVLTSWLFLGFREALGYDVSALLASVISLVVMLPLSWALWRWIDLPTIRLSEKIGARYRESLEPERV